MKTCEVCGGTERTKNRQCRGCKNLYNHDRQKQIRTPETNRVWNLKRNYGVTVEDYNKIFESQQGCCFICGRHQIEFKRHLCIDHNHTTGKIRKLLCSPCNVGLGYYELKKEEFEKYLKETEHE